MAAQGAVRRRDSALQRQQPADQPPVPSPTAVRARPSGRRSGRGRVRRRPSPRRVAASARAPRPRPPGRGSLRVGRFRTGGRRPISPPGRCPRVDWRPPQIPAGPGPEISKTGASSAIQMPELEWSEVHSPRPRAARTGHQDGPPGRAGSKGRVGGPDLRPGLRQGFGPGQRRRGPRGAKAQCSLAWRSSGAAATGLPLLTVTRVRRPSPVQIATVTDWPILACIPRPAAGPRWPAPARPRIVPVCLPRGAALSPAAPCGVRRAATCGQSGCRDTWGAGVTCRRGRGRTPRSAGWRRGRAGR